MSIGDGVRIDPFSLLSAGERIEIGNHVHVATQCILVGSAPIFMGDFSGMSHGAHLLSASDDFVGAGLIGPTVPEAYRNVTASPVTLARHAVVGAGTVVLPGAVLEEGATVGALSLVAKTLAAWTVYAGTPARRIAARDREGVVEAERRFLRDSAHGASV